MYSIQDINSNSSPALEPQKNPKARPRVSAEIGQSAGWGAFPAPMTDLESVKLHLLGPADSCRSSHRTGGLWDVGRQSEVSRAGSLHPQADLSLEAVCSLWRRGVGH